MKSLPAFDLEKQHLKGKLHAIERLRAISPDFSPFYDQQEYDGVIVGSGTVGGRRVYLYAQDFTYHGGTLGSVHGKAIADLIRLAVKEGCPIIGIVDSGGARIQEGLSALAAYGDVFLANTHASGRVPQYSIIAGPCAGGAVYSPGITDFVMTIEGVSQMFVTGPQVVKEVTGVSVSPQALGGAELHAAKSGVACLSFPDEAQCFSTLRRMIAMLPASANDRRTRRLLPFTSQEDPAQYIPQSSKRTYNVQNVLECIVDSGSFLELSPRFAANVVIGLAALGGCTVGVVANQPGVKAGVLDCDASDKAARFVRFCDCYHIPILTFVDTPGYLPGVEQEKAGIIRHGAKLLYAYSEATTLKLTVVLRKAYGGAYIAMSSKSLGARRAYAWSGAEMAVMGAQGAVEILYGKAAETMPADQRDGWLREQREKYEATVVNCDGALQMGYIDQIIDPAKTRRILYDDLAAYLRSRRRPHGFVHGNIPL